MKTSEKIVKARNESNLTQDQLAELLNVSRQTISKWELDISVPETSKLTRLAEVLNVSIDYLLNEQERDQNAKIPMKQGEASFEPDWTELYPVLKQYESEVDCEHYYKIFQDLFTEVEKRYHYSPENAMLVIKDMMAKAYFQKLK